jgi:hypothetical protein
MTDAMFRRTGWGKPSWKLSIILERQNETQRLEGHWRSSGILYRDNLEAGGGCARRGQEPSLNE